MTLIDLPADAEIIVTTEQLNKIMEQSLFSGRLYMLHDIKKALGFSTNKSWDDCLPVVLEWKRKAEAQGEKQE